MIVAAYSVEESLGQSLYPELVFGAKGCITGKVQTEGSDETDITPLSQDPDTLYEGRLFKEDRVFPINRDDYTAIVLVFFPFYHF